MASAFSLNKIESDMTVKQRKRIHVGIPFETSKSIYSISMSTIKVKEVQQLLYVPAEKCTSEQSGEHMLSVLELATACLFSSLHLFFSFLNYKIECRSSTLLRHRTSNS
jgi:hypothetical protein